MSEYMYGEITRNYAFDFMDMLQKTGKTNMIGAGAYLREHLHVTRKEANKIITDWIEKLNKEASLMELLIGE